MTLWISECTVLPCDFFINAEISSTPGEFYIFKFQQPLNLEDTRLVVQLFIC